MMNENHGTKIVLFSASAFFGLLGIIILCSGGIGFGIFVMVFAIVFFGFGLKEHFSDIKIKEHAKLLNESFNRSVAAFEDKISYESVNRARKDAFSYIAILSKEEYKEKRNLVPYSLMCIATTTAELDNLTFAILYYHYADFTSMIKELKETFKITGNINWGELKQSMFYFLTKEHDVNTLDLKDEKNVEFIKSICDIIESSIERIRIEPKRPTTSSAPAISKTEKLVLAREFLVSYYLDLTDEMIEDFKKEEPSQEEIAFLGSKRPLIEHSIRAYIIDKEEKYGSFFLTADTDENDTAQHIISLIGKYAFSVTLYYFFEFDNALPLHSKKEVVSAIQEAIENPTTELIDHAALKLAILKHLQQG